MTILCNNAGANFRVSFDDQTEEMWHTVMNIGLTGAFLVIKAAVPAMRRAGGGAIVNMGSLASTRSGGGSLAYGASKAGIVGLTTRSAAKPYASDGIRCNMFSPGHVDTPFIRQDNAHSPNDWPPTIDNPDNCQRRLDATRLGRLQIPEDIAKAFLFLASDGALMITRVNPKVDGGAGI